MNRAALCIAIAAWLSACHYHRDTNAPAIVNVEEPPENPASRQMEYPDDPGERMITLSTGVLAGGGGRFKDPSGVGDFAAEVTINRGENETSHNDNDKYRLFIPRGAIWPSRGYGATLGWSALHIAGGNPGQDTDVDIGPIYAEAQVIRSPFALGGGWAVQPTNGDHGPQINVVCGVVYFRTRYLFDGGLEMHLGYQLKIPTTWVWSR